MLLQHKILPQILIFFPIITWLLIFIEKDCNWGDTEFIQVGYNDKTLYP